MSSFGLQSLSSEMTNQNTGKDFVLCLMLTRIGDDSYDPEIAKLSA